VRDVVLSEERSRPNEMRSPKRDFIRNFGSTLAQARKLSLSETGLVA